MNENDNKALTLARMFGGQKQLAEAIGVDRAVVNRWVANSGRRAGGGAIPANYYDKIMVAAKERVRDGSVAPTWFAEVCALLPPRTCPTCGHTMKIGQVI